MPLSDMQRGVMDVLQRFRSEQSYVGGGAALNLEWPRLSDERTLWRTSQNVR